MIQRLLFFICLSLLASVSRSQQGSDVTIFTSFNRGDSVNTITSLLVTELGRSIKINAAVSDPAGFRGKGIVLLKRNAAARYGIKFPFSLASMGSEAVFINGNSESVIIIGNSALALQQAVFIYLEQLGFRYLMPGKLWEVVPELQSVYKKINILTRPLYDWRQITNGHGYANRKAIENDFNRWFMANRLGGGFRMWLGHAYDEIVQNNIEEFKQHPEYFAQTVAKGSIPQTPKFNVANRQLVDLVVRDAVKRMERIRSQDSGIILLSMEPSDDGGFCTTSECRAIGNSSDQVFYLANEAAKAVRKKFPGTWVGSYAYNEHMKVTRLPLEPNVLVMVTNGFNRTEFNTYELLQQWSKKAKKLGVYEYLSVYEWDQDLPGQVTIANTKYLQNSVKEYYLNGATTYIGESVMGWIHKGWGQYLLARLLWDYRINTDSLKQDFFRQAFGKAAPELMKVYEGWENNQHRIPRDNEMYDWIELIRRGYEKADRKIYKDRINQVKMYMHYISLYRELKKNPSKSKYFEIMHFAHRSFDIAAFPTLPTMVSLGNYTGYGEYGYWNKPSEEWKATVPAPMTEQELENAFRKDFQSLKRVEGIPVMPATTGFTPLSSVISLPKKAWDHSNHTFWGPTEFIIKINTKGQANNFTIASDYSASPHRDAKVTMSLFAWKGKAIELSDKPVLKFYQSKKQELESFDLSSLDPGYYVLQIEDYRKMFTIKFSSPILYSVVGKANPKIQTTSAGGLNVFYFVVPKGVKKFLVDKTIAFKLFSPTGRRIDRSNNLDETFEVEVMQGEEGIWEIYHQSGMFYIEGIPPYYSGHPDRMIVPTYIK